MIGTKYACNDSYYGDSICFQSQIWNGLYMLATSFNRDQLCLQCPEVTWQLRSRDDCKYNWSLLNEVAKIYSPFRILDCKHIRSPFWSWLQAYLLHPYINAYFWLPQSIGTAQSLFGLWSISVENWDFSFSWADAKRTFRWTNAVRRIRRGSLWLGVKWEDCHVITNATLNATSPVICLVIK